VADVPKGFPSWRVWRRARLHAKRSLEHASAPGVTAVLGAVGAAVYNAHTTITAPVRHGLVQIHQSWPGVLLAALVGGAVGYVIYWCLWVGRHLASYRRSRTDDAWEMEGHLLLGSGASFSLQPKPGHQPWPFEGPRLLECHIETPSQTIDSVSCNGPSAYFQGVEEIGCYKVRWYGAEQADKFYEMTRGSFRFDSGPRPYPQPMVERKYE